MFWQQSVQRLDELSHRNEQNKRRVLTSGSNDSYPHLKELHLQDDDAVMCRHNISDFAGDRGQGAKCGV
jgi:hypothetical protein